MTIMARTILLAFFCAQASRPDTENQSNNKINCALNKISYICIVILVV